MLYLIGDNAACYGKLLCSLYSKTSIKAKIVNYIFFVVHDVFCIMSGLNLHFPVFSVGATQKHWHPECG